MHINCIWATRKLQILEWRSISHNRSGKLLTGRLKYWLKGAQRRLQRTTNMPVISLLTNICNKYMQTYICKYMCSYYCCRAFKTQYLHVSRRALMHMCCCFCSFCSFFWVFFFALPLRPTATSTIAACTKRTVCMTQRRPKGSFDRPSERVIITYNFAGFLRTFSLLCALFVILHYTHVYIYIHTHALVNAYNWKDICVYIYMCVNLFVHIFICM